MIHRLIILFLFVIQALSLHAEEETWYFRVYLNDKGDSGYTLDKPEEYLSATAIKRREQYHIPITHSDIPIADSHIKLLTAHGGQVITQSRWLSTVVIEGTDSLIVDALKQISIVDSVKWVWKGTKSLLNREAENSQGILIPQETVQPSYYGYGQSQIEMLNGIHLHASGYNGEDMHIAVIDAGFTNVDRISVFDSLQLAGTRNFVSPDESVFSGDDHGTKVLSCMAANYPGVLVGTAPKAKYWLLKSEDSRSEFPVEEDYWTAAVEFADSVGVSIISSSLGYFNFDIEEMNYSQEGLDGKTAFISRAAALAAQKGILIVCSAGNEGNNWWEKITFPSDTEDILTVGSITEEKEKSNFSSTGFTSDYRVKPDLVALGTGSCVINGNGDLLYANGTSFSTPIVAGLAACLWQSLPALNHTELIHLLQQTASQHKRPDAEKGYGIPNFDKAYKKGKKYAEANGRNAE